jgi:uncharacterized protein
VLWRWVAVLLGLVLGGAVALVAVPAFALDVPPLTGRINDRAGLLSPAVQQELESRLTAYESKTGHQIALLTIPSLEGDSIEDFSIRVVEAWKLGAKARDDGVLLLIAVQDRKMRIEVGYGLGGDLPDVLTGRIIREVMAPAFRNGDPAQGISRALGAIMAATGGEGEPLAQPRRASRDRGGGGLVPYLLVALVLFLFLGGGGGRRGRRFGGGPMIFGAGLGGGGFRGGGFGGGRGGGGGGFGGGGGGFGGGGASGSW